MLGLSSYGAYWLTYFFFFHRWWRIRYLTTFFLGEDIYWNSSSDESNRVFSLFFTFVTFDGIPCPGCPPGITEPLVAAIPTELLCFEVSLVSSCVFTSPYCSVFLCRLPPAISEIRLNDNRSRIYQCTIICISWH